VLAGSLRFGRPPENPGRQAHLPRTDCPLTTGHPLKRRCAEPSNLSAANSGIATLSIGTESAICADLGATPFRWLSRIVIAEGESSRWAVILAQSSEPSYRTEPGSGAGPGS